MKSLNAAPGSSTTLALVLTWFLYAGNVMSEQLSTFCRGIRPDPRVVQALRTRSQTLRGTDLASGYM